MSQINVNKVISPNQALSGGPSIEIESNGNIKLDSGVLFVDSVNDRVGINTTTPTRTLDISGNGGWKLGAGFIREKIVVATGTTPSGDLDINIQDGNSQIVGAASTTFAPNFRFNAGNTFNALIQDNQLIQYSLIHTVSSSSGYINAIKVDGVSQTVEWVEGTAPTQAGSPEVAATTGYDIYQITILKTGASTYKVFASQNHLE